MTFTSVRHSQLCWALSVTATEEHRYGKSISCKPSSRPAKSDGMCEGRILRYLTITLTTVRIVFLKIISSMSNRYLVLH